MASISTVLEEGEEGRRFAKRARVEAEEKGKVSSSSAAATAVLDLTEDDE